ncbi:IclR family transcriptional regulator [Amycolatopsis saalfeldensis]|uniref:DNA-binding transcriptional regulator, IclR family n=1 Tax=Amycolatopsis saalfeldensis TaxID=394193 RepID=A0A1H8Y8N0_9PSEU|nr:IclR family transcriptional regulator C-terminal domain-containing protein [Amycolatopsis saalfeldensis]SEP48505.1 DNA-binding transcriptional regulator, IclR family [Amycolatopsis saalfeldensis]
MTEDAADPAGPKNHRTIDRVTQILEEVVYHPGIGFAELARALDAPKSSVHGFIRGLQAKGWLYEDDKRFYLGPAIYGLTMASGHIRAGQVSQADLDALHRDTGMTVFLGVEAGDHLIYIGESGTDALTGFAARTNIRRKLLSTAGGKALLAAKPDAERDGYLRRNHSDSEAVSEFLSEFAEIKKTGVSRNFRHHGAQLAFSTVVRNPAGESVAAAVVVGQTAEVQPREAKVRKLLVKHVASWTQQKTAPREPI